MFGDCDCLCGGLAPPQADTRLAVTSLEVMKRDIELQASEINALQTTLDRNLKASAVEIARLENQMARECVGTTVVELSSWDISEFDFLGTWSWWRSGL